MRALLEFAAYDLPAADYLTGLDVSRSAVQALTEQAAHFGIAVRARQADLLRLKPVRDLVAGRTVVTNYVLEQLPRHLTAALEQIASARPPQVLHIEPCPDRLPGRRVWERWPSAWHSRSHGYQRQLLAALTAAQNQGHPGDAAGLLAVPVPQRRTHQMGAGPWGIT